MSKKESSVSSSKKERVLITLNALDHNRGSEALVRGLVAAIRSGKGNAEIVVCSGESKDQKLIIEGVDYMCPRLQRGARFSPLFCIQVFFEKVLKKQLKFCYRPLIEEVKKADYVYVIGADNYDPLYGIQEKVKQINDMIFESATGEVYLIDCSLEEKDITPKIIEDISRFKLITVRETISYKAMVKKLPTAKVELIPDPAFIMNKQEVTVQGLKLDEPYVGINISDVILNAEKGAKELIVNNYKRVIEYIINDAHLNVLLIPHVMGNRDMSALRELYQYYKEDERVVLVQNETYNAEEIKYLISKCRFIITARTHASIAAYSMCIPTLVIGYSVKSLGIAEDIFGQSEEYVVSISDLKRETDITEHFDWIVKNEISIKGYLQSFMPDYRNKVLTYNKL